MLGAGNRNLAQIVTVLGTVLSRGSTLVEPADAARMVTLLQQMQSSLPPQVALCPLPGFQLQGSRHDGQG